MLCVLAGFLLNFDQKKCRMSIDQELLNDLNDDLDLLKRVITVDESWVYDCDIESQSPIVPMEDFR